MLKQHEEGRWQSENLEVLPEEISKEQILWVAQDPTNSEMNELKEYFALDEHDIQELAEEGVRSRIDEHEDRVFCLLNFHIGTVSFLMEKLNARRCLFAQDG